MGRNDASWMDEEDERAEQQVETGKRPNAEAPQLVRKEAKAPTRSTKGFYIQEKYAMAFDKLVFSQKQVKGKKAPELAEEAIKTLLKKYGEDTKGL
ncbi:conserved hypothetical protein [Bathymodiolus platifrons methanotrophic gill symbiont]|uniref:hypothetical protein n=1 Tax=Bathymodiolus platifrons methanotrophic gill symbiont TaxID=113268 RepID=UPI000B41FCEC|nr:hypothetical protein [Bathymodiolus platifrons methanotrophic gill symbiont]TXK93323.1 hypothetical protein BMR11_17125 [Methylococcaceae bacterium CS5]TXK93826.1 hypothetical protein BMR10_14845 [Methylococcaceae bacterium CS4]TXK94263.1 hypothetical protein BMR02_14115 [Methylococcaceae bacterium HT1]TXL02143.1 hypothetical protein BMR07_18435 [Methylococcaceae bacterium CS1]TXL07391.1 hypothetical protein BMR09_05820 [Methylococcaceae bacterium CS3]TXL08207.1 hypothetical protein BMR08_